MACSQYLRLRMCGKQDHAFETLNGDPAAHLVLGELLARGQDITKDLQTRSLDQRFGDFLLELLAVRSNVNDFTGRGVMKCHEVFPFSEIVRYRAMSASGGQAVFAQRSSSGSFAATPFQWSASAGAGILASITGHNGASSALICTKFSSPAGISSSRKMESAGHSATQSVYLHLMQLSVTTWVMSDAPQAHKAGYPGADSRPGHRTPADREPSNAFRFPRRGRHRVSRRPEDANAAQEPCFTIHAAICGHTSCRLRAPMNRPT